MLEEASEKELMSKPSEEDVSTHATLTYTVDEAIDSTGYGKFQHFCTINAGMSWLANSVMTLKISIMGSLIGCDWAIKEWELTAYTAILFVGLVAGSFLFGVLADKIGRKKAFILHAALMFCFSTACAVSPNTWFLMAFRGLLGISLGGLPIGITLCTEYYPTVYRGVAGFFLCYFWSGGILLTILGTWVLLQVTKNWRWFILMGSTPALIATILSLFSPESVRYLLSNNQYEEAKKQLQKIADMNKTTLPPGQLKIIRMDDEESGKLIDLLAPEFRRTTLLFWYMWFALSLNYFGLALLTPLIVDNGSVFQRDIVFHNKSFPNTDAACKIGDSFHFINMLWTSASEIPGIMVFNVLIMYIARRKLTAWSMFVLFITTMLLLINVKAHWLIKSVLFTARGISTGAHQLIYIVTGELFPTRLRGTGMGSSQAFSEFGSILAPYVSEIFVMENPVGAISILGISVLLSAICAALLPKETKDTGLAQLEKELMEEAQRIEPSDVSL